MFEILTVCTGNICRSVLAEGLLRRDLPKKHFHVSSAGIMAVPNGAVPRRQLKIARKLGISGLEQHQSRLTTLDLVHSKDLVLAMSRGHRKRLIQLDPAATRRTFTIREFARLAPLVTPNDVEAQISKTGSPLRAAIRAVSLKRGMLPPPKDAEDLDVVDPFRQSAKTYRLSRDQIVPAAEITAQFLTSVVDIFGAHEVDLEPEVELPEIRQEAATPFPSRATIRRANKTQPTRPDFPVAAPNGLGETQKWDFAIPAKTSSILDEVD